MTIINRMMGYRDRPAQNLGRHPGLMKIAGKADIIIWG